MTEESKKEMISLQEAHKRAEAMRKDMNETVDRYEKKNSELLEHRENTKKLYDAMSDDMKQTLLDERQKSFDILRDQRYNLLISVYKKLEALSNFVVEVKTEQVKSYNDVLAKMKTECEKCPSGNCPAMTFFDQPA